MESRTQKKSETKAKNRLLEAKDRNARGQGQGTSTPAQLFSIILKKEKKGYQKHFPGDLQKEKGLRTRRRRIFSKNQAFSEK